MGTFFWTLWGLVGCRWDAPQPLIPVEVELRGVGEGAHVPVAVKSGRHERWQVVGFLDGAGRWSGEVAAGSFVTPFAPTSPAEAPVPAGGGKVSFQRESSCWRTVSSAPGSEVYVSSLVLYEPEWLGVTNTDGKLGPIPSSCSDNERVWLAFGPSGWGHTVSAQSDVSIPTSHPVIHASGTFTWSDGSPARGLLELGVAESALGGLRSEVPPILEFLRWMDSPVLFTPRVSPDGTWEMWLPAPEDGAVGAAHWQVDGGRPGWYPIVAGRPSRAHLVASGKRLRIGPR